MREVKVDEVKSGIGWSKLTLQQGIPVQLMDEEYVVLQLWMARSSKSDIKRASKSPMAKDKDDDTVATITLTNCIVALTDHLFTKEQAMAHLVALDENDTEKQKDILENPVTKGAPCEPLFILPKNLEDDEVILGDIEALTDAFKMVNRIGMREAGSFFVISRN